MDNNNPTYTDHPHPYNNNNNISISSMEEDELLLLHEPSFDHHHPWPCTLPPPPGSNEIFGSHPAVAALEEEEEEEELGAMKEMMFKMAAMQPVDIDPATIRRPRRRNVRISEDPQSVAARLRRERISEKMRILQRLVPGGTKMDTASMLDEAIRYVKFLKRQLRILQHPTIHHHHHHHHPISSFNRTY